MGSSKVLGLLLIIQLFMPAISSAQSMSTGSGVFGQPGPGSGETYPVDGIVVNAITGEPIRRALVQAPNGGQLTGADGKFHFEKLPPGQYNFLARKPGYFSEQDLSPGLFRNSPIQVGPSMPPLVLKLTPEAVIYGRITGADGEPLENLPMRLFAYRVVNGHKQWQQLGGQTTNDDGQFRIAELRPGTYYLRAGQPFLAVARPADPQKPAEGYASAFYPGARDLESAAAIKIEAGQQYRAEFSLQPVAMYQVSGTVTGITVGVNGVGIQLFTSDGETLPFGANLDRATGKFLMQSVPAGSYIVNATAMDVTTRQEFVARIPLNVSGDVAGVSLALGAALSIPVTVRIDASRTTSPEFIVSGAPRPPVNVQLVSTDVGLINYRVGSNMDGPPESRRLTLRIIRPGKFRVEITPLGPFYVSEARSGRVDLLREELTIPYGGSVEPIEIVMRDDAATLQGSVSFSGQRIDAIVILVPAMAPRRARVEFAQPEGSFFIGGLAPGEYRILALDHVDDLEYAEPDGLVDFSGAMQTVRLGPNQQGTVTLELVRRPK
jgi:hypothetical protein